MLLSVELSVSSPSEEAAERQAFFPAAPGKKGQGPDGEVPVPAYAEMQRDGRLGSRMLVIFEAGDAWQKDCGNCFRKSLIPWTAVADLPLDQNDNLFGGAWGTSSSVLGFFLVPGWGKVIR